MKKFYFTVTGTCFRYGTSFMERGDEVRLIKEPDNKADPEAIKVEVEGIGLIGYVANSIKTVVGDTFSAGRLYDKIGDETIAVVKYVMDDALVCELEGM